MPHAIRYFCATAAGDFVDAQNPGTGRLTGAINRTYDLGSGTQGHQAIKESQAVFADFLPLLNAAPPVTPVTLTVHPDSGGYPAPLVVAVDASANDLDIAVLARRLTRRVAAGYVVDTVAETKSATLRDGDTLTLDASGMWEVSATASGVVEPAVRIYWVGVDPVSATIVTDNAVPFENSVLVTAATSDPTASLYHSRDGSTWSQGATVSITDDTVVSFIAITPGGIASPVVSKAFTRRVTFDDAVTASAIDHFIAGRIDSARYLAYAEQFGFFTPFTLYRVNGTWVLDPAPHGPSVPAPAGAVPAAPPPIPLVQAAPPPGTYPAASLTVTLTLAGDAATHTVHYTRDGSIPDTRAESFTGITSIELTGGNQVIACVVADDAGSRTYQVFHYTLRS